MTIRDVKRRDAVVHYTVDGTAHQWRIAASVDDTDETVRAHTRRFRPSIVIDRVSFDDGDPDNEEKPQ